MSRSAYQRWFLAAAIYNVLWGAWVVLFPEAYFHLIDMPPPSPKAIWQSVGMIVMVYGPAYYLVARQPERYAAVAWVGLLGKVLGPAGFVFGVVTGDLPIRFGLTLLINDVLWWPVFLAFCLKYARRPFDSQIQS